MGPWRTAGRPRGACTLAPQLGRGLAADSGVDPEAAGSLLS